MFESIINNTAGILSVHSVAICTGASLLLGALIALFYSLSGKGSKNFCISLIILPSMVQTVIMLVNGSLGAGIAIVGAFSLIRFRSIPGNSRDISSIFLAMVTGLATGMGYIVYACFIAVSMGIVMVIVHLLPIYAKQEHQQSLKITIYENLDYTNVFDDIFQEYLKFFEVESVKTTNMGSMYQISYLIEQKDRKKEKEFIDALRCRNGNLTIICGRVIPSVEQL